MKGETKVGVTKGLSHPCDNKKPEQVYVYLTDDETRPIAIEGWVGYSVDQRLELTPAQAKGLIPLLVEAVTEGVPREPV